MISDPNWLYSTIAQSSAAIVAIIGGFITASLLMLLSERRSTANQLKDREARLDGLRSRGGGFFGGGGGGKESESFREDEISSMEREVESLGERRNAFSYPKNLGWGIVVLGYLAVFGILSPILMMAFDAFFTWTKVLVVVTFSFGIVGLFAYITIQMKALKR